MRIIEWAFPFLPVQGGREVFVDKLSTALVKEGHEVLVVTGNAGDDSAAPYETLRLDINPQQGNQKFSIANVLEQLRKLATSFKPDIIHFHNYTSSDLFLLGVLKKACSAPLVLTVHNEVKSVELTKEVESRFAWLDNHVSAIVCVSKFVANSASNNWPEMSFEVATILNGTDDRYKDAPLGTDVLFLGRLDAGKGAESLISAMQLVLTRSPGARLKICGDGPMRPALENHALRLGVQESVSFTGWLTGTDLDRALELARIVVVPSAWREPFGLVAIEAMMQSRPVIVSDRGALPEIVRDSIDGFHFQPGDLFELATRIDWLLCDKTLAIEMGRSGRLRALDLFDMSSTASQYSTFFSKLAQAQA